MLLGGTQTPKVQKLGVQKRSVFLPVGGGVGQFEKQTQTWKNCATLRYVCAVCFIVLLKSCDVSPDRLWPRPCNTTSVWRTSIWSVATSALKGQRLGVWWRWCHEGRGCEERQRKGQSTAVWQWGQGNDERQCSALLVLRCAKFWSLYKSYGETLSRYSASSLILNTFLNL